LAVRPVLSTFYAKLPDAEDYAAGVFSPMAHPPLYRDRLAGQDRRRPGS
jgi:hypothetical protein